MNLSQLRSWVVTQTLIPAANEVIDGYINQAYLELATVHEWPWLETVSTFPLVEGTSEYPLPTDMSRLRAVVYLAQGARAQPQSSSLFSVLARLGDDVGSSDLPTEYYRQGSNLIFVPTPSSAQDVALIYLASPSLLAGDEDEPAFDPAFHVFLAQSAAALYFESEDSYEHASYYHAQASDTFFRLVQFYQVQLPTESLVIGGGSSRRYKPFADWGE